MRTDAVLVDTDVWSFFIKGDSRAALYEPHLRGKTIAISFVTVGELFYWAEKRAWGERRRADLETRLKSAVIIPFDLQICQEYARVSVARNNLANDRWIAACAIRHRLPLVSHNRRHFEGIPGLVLLSETPSPRTSAERPLLLDSNE